MKLCNLRLAGGSRPGPVDIRIENERISSIDPSVTDSRFSPEGLDAVLSGAIVLPGLINSHDHLDFNLFPAMANRIYSNYRQWGQDIHENNRSQIGEVLRIPQSLRISWGLYKNLLNGVTTVVNHGDRLSIDPDAAGIGVLQTRSLHSVGFEKNWKWKINRPFGGKRAVVIHVGEGTDEMAAREIDRLLAWNLLRTPLIGIHGVAMNEEQAAGFKALVWCIDSNYRLLDRTAAVDRLKNRLPILFGTDSTLTSDWNIWEQIRLARRSGLLTDQELLASLTSKAAPVWGLADTGSLVPGMYADLVVARPGPSTGMDALFSINPEDILLVLYHGKVRLFDAALATGPEGLYPGHAGFCPVTVGHSRKFVYGDLPGLIRRIREAHPGAEIPVEVD
ncbi:MAG: amidohydrolase family protein [Bacteroidota bacterium]|nr:amidohydrolase family protein [Bacteroidota bacterium]MDP4245092.1 amidohydrolase family protein [Bacteroidota bacterium]MDP4252538.1 amidohydrolase family protein [Bacteroidota bacterium]